MNRILLSTADQRDDLYWYNGEAFTGIGFERGAGRTVRPFHLQEGRIIGPYKSVCEEGWDAALHIDLLGDTGVFGTDDEPKTIFTGMGYEFSDGICAFEGYFEDGYPSTEAWWFPDGTMSACDLRGRGIISSERYKWYVNRKLENCVIETRSSSEFSIRFSAGGLLNVLRLEGGVLRVFGDVVRDARYMPIRNVSDIYKLRAAKELFLIGDEIDGDFVQSLVESGVAVDVENLDLHQTQVERISLSTLVGMRHLKELSIESKYLGQIGLAQSVKKAKPNLKVSFNQADIGAS